MERRTLLGLLAASVAAATLSACASPEPGAGEGDDDAAPAAPAAPSPPTRVFGEPAGIVKVPVPRGTLSRLPGPGQQLALTVDDGTDSRVVAAYARLAQATGIRLTFFCNGVNRSWTDSAPTLRPLVESGQVWIANHTWSHPDLTKISAVKVADEVRRNEAFLTNTFGVTGRPFLRPPYGARSTALDAQLADLGYPAVTMWLGTLGDSTTQPPATILSMAQQWFLPQHLVIGHANHPGVDQVMDGLVQLIQSRGLTPVHLGDVFDTATAPAPKA